MRVLVTGSREIPTNRPIFKALDAAYRRWYHEFSQVSLEPGPDNVEGFVVVHGNADGADTFAGEWVKHRRDAPWPPYVEVHPADWSKGPIAGPQRNQEMVWTNPDLVLAFFRVGSANRGTRDCVERAKTWLGWKGVPIIEEWV